MTPETITILGVGIALACIILYTSRDASRALADIRKEMVDLRMKMTDLRKEMTELCERMARLEGLFEGFAGRKPPMAAQWKPKGGRRQDNGGAT